MGNESNFLKDAIDFLNGIIWSPALIFLCLGAGLFFSIVTRFVQVRHFLEMWRLLFRKDPNQNEHGISSFQALAVSLSGRVGVGNIAGVAAAIGFGGPGAVFWMWVVAFLGAGTAYVESTLGQIYKIQDPITNQYRGGPAFYFERCLGWKWYGILFAVAITISCGLFLPGPQANAVASAATAVVGEGDMVSTGVAGMVGSNRLIATAGILILLGFIIFGGIKRIAHFAEFVVPFMALAYIILALIIVFVNINRVPELITLIIGDAFRPEAGLGAAIGWGVKRGVYSNEAGQGTGPQPAAAAEVEHPVQQGLVQAFSVYIDTLFVCTATALMILMTHQYNVVTDQTFAGADTQYIVANIKDAAGTIVNMNPNSPAFTQAALHSVFGTTGPQLVAIATFFFAFTTILAYYYIAETNIIYLAHKLKLGSGVVMIVKLSVMFAVAYGAVGSAGYIWDLGDVGVGMTAWLNIVGILGIFFLAKPTMTALRDYEQQQKNNVEVYTFNPKALGIKNATFWEKRWEENNPTTAATTDATETKPEKS